jgi:hypothetical protein
MEVINRSDVFKYLVQGMKVKITNTYSYDNRWNDGGAMEYLFDKIVDVTRIDIPYGYTHNYSTHSFHFEGWWIYGGMIDAIVDSNSNKVLYKCIGHG